jgi:hypothetical protein
VLVAVIDSQVDVEHPDLAGSIVGQFNAASLRMPAATGRHRRRTRMPARL